MPGRPACSKDLGHGNYDLGIVLSDVAHDFVGANTTDAGTYRDIFVGAVGAPQKAIFTAARQSVIQPGDHAGRGIGDVGHGQTT
ncbi:hypothetical protein MAUB1S_11462 [Mycolicibacterium aubagnense]